MTQKENKIQYIVALEVGRIGMSVDISEVNPTGGVMTEFSAMLNGKGLLVTRKRGDGPEVVICGFDDFLEPSNVSDDDVALITMVTETPHRLDGEMIKLASSLVNFYRDGFTEEFMWSWVDKIISTW